MAMISLEPRAFRVDGDVPVLLGSECSACAQRFFPRRRLCAICRRPTTNVDLSGSGVLHSYTYVHQPIFGGQRLDAAGYGVGTVDLEDGVRVQSAIAGDPSSWHTGLRMDI